MKEYHKCKLKPCPFCGKDYSEICGVEHGAVEGGNSQFFVQCVNCSVRMEQDRRDKVIGMWNTRIEQWICTRNREEDGTKFNQQSKKQKGHNAPLPNQLN